VSENVAAYIKNFASAAARSSAFRSFLTALESSDGQKPGFLRVLTYHRVDEPQKRPWLDPGLISASPREFEQQMRFLRNHYEVVSASDVIAAFNSGDPKQLPSRAVAVTFDDGYYDFEEQAWPVLKQYSIPTILFVPTAYPDHPEQTFWWDDLFHALKNTKRKDDLKTAIGVFSLSDAGSRNQIYQRLKNYIKTLKHPEALAAVKALCSDLGVAPAQNCIMSWDLLRKLNQDGLTLGAHTRTHPLVNRISLQEARDEVVGSLQDLQREVGSVLPIFAYPSGEFSDDVAKMLEKEGFALAFTTVRGINKLGDMDPFKIKRINVGGRTTLPILRAQMLSWSTRFTWMYRRLNV
jgi:peptidoglycan/xylan/chitin deacetylase (PgdA/CDA1 family)